MIRSLKLRNYRGFDDYRLEHLADVNLFVGRNNAGKTSLLEAAQLAHAISPLSVLKAIALRRRESRVRRSVPKPGVVFESVNVSHSFTSNRLVSGQILEISGQGIPNLTFAIQPPSGSSFPGWSISGELELVARRDNEPVETGVLANGGFLFPQTLRSNLGGPPRENSVFISPDSLAMRALIDLSNEVIASATEGQLVDAVRILDPKVSGVFLIRDRGSVEILITDNGTDRNPIGSYGDGMRRMLALAMAFVNCRSGVLLVDELDTGLHYDVMPDLWHWVTGTSTNLGAQVFATTHSLDCVRGLNLAIEANLEIAQRVAVHKIDRRLKQAVTFTGEELILALRNDLELR